MPNPPASSWLLPGSFGGYPAYSWPNDLWVICFSLLQTPSGWTGGRQLRQLSGAVRAVSLPWRRAVR
jgi:hypothetical protein